jgi:Flp pilus assembly pilin Flp
VGETRSSLFSKLNPAVPRYYLFGLAGAFWTFAGVLLCARAIIWLNTFPLSIELALEATSIAIAIVGYLYLFVKVVQKNIDRIGQLPENACIFAFSAWRGYVMIGFMMTIGITLRNTSVPKYWLAVPYTAMGAILLIGSARFFHQFATSMARRKS